MSSKRIREINIEVERVRVVSNLKKSKSNCETCATEAEFISLSNATQIFGMNETEVNQLALERLIHLKMSPNNEMLVCLSSLLIANNCF